MKQVLSIQDLSCVGRCSLSVAMPVLSAMGCQCIGLPTAVLSSHTGFPQPHIRSLTQDIGPTCRHWQSLGLSFDAISVGYLADPDQAAQVEAVLQAFPAVTVVDPVMGDHGRLYSGITAAHVQAMARLCSRAQVALPNLTEAAQLTGLCWEQTWDKDYYRRLAAGMLALGAEAVVLTGVTTAPDKLGFLAVAQGQEYFYQTHRIPRQLHGTGDLFTAVFTGSLALGRSIFDAATLAAGFVEQVLSATQTATPFGAEFEPQLPWLWERLK